MAIQPGGEVWQERRQLAAAADEALRLLANGATAAACETEGVDFKEEAGRRGRGGQILPGEAHNQAVAEQIANEVACLANTTGGGALIVGIADDAREIGAVTDRDWLRQRIHEQIDVAPAIEERTLPSGTRVLIVMVSEAREPVEDTGDRLRWRVGRVCVPVDRSEWWADRFRRLGTDPLTAPTARTLADLPQASLVAVRRLLRSGSSQTNELIDLPDRELLTRLGVLLPDGHLTAAGVHMFAAAPRTVLELVVLDVPGGDVISPAPDLAGLSLIEQLVEVETRLDALDTAVVVGSGLHLGPIRKIPWLAVREALLNAVVHRDWLPLETIHLTWVQADATLDVVSPGGFAGGVTSRSVLSSRYSRNPALADLARALGLVERQGVGVDRMYREMVVLGHRPPSIQEISGPSIRTRLAGGDPLTAVIAVVTAIEPAVRQRDVRVALVVHALLRDGFATAQSVGELLQIPADEAEEALEAVTRCTIGDGSVIRPAAASGTWLPGIGVAQRATADAKALEIAQLRGLLTWWRPNAEAAKRLVEKWLRTNGRISSGDFADITGFTSQGALQVLNRLVSEGLLRRGDASRGRRAHFVAGDGGRGGSRPAR